MKLFHSVLGFELPDFDPGHPGCLHKRRHIYSVGSIALRQAPLQARAIRASQCSTCRQRAELARNFEKTPEKISKTPRTKGSSLSLGAVQAQPGLATSNGFLRAPSMTDPTIDVSKVPCHSLCGQACGCDGPGQVSALKIEEHTRPYPAPWYR